MTRMLFLPFAAPLQSLHFTGKLGGKFWRRFGPIHVPHSQIHPSILSVRITPALLFFKYSQLAPRHFFPIGAPSTEYFVLNWCPKYFVLNWCQTHVSIRASRLIFNPCHSTLLNSWSSTSSQFVSNTHFNSCRTHINRYLTHTLNPRAQTQSESPPYANKEE